MNKLALGTVQFGLNYGINNTRGKIPKGEVFEILTYAYHNGIDFLDTSYAYGDSEVVLGDYIKQSNLKFNIISKLPKNNLNDSRGIFYQSLDRLYMDRIYGYLIHHFDFFLDNREIWYELEQIKGEGLVEKIGFSLYYPEELDYILDKNIDFDILQVPYSIFDQRFSSYFSKLKEINKEIHIRSVFLQGLLLKSLDEIPEKFFKIRPKLNTLNQLSKDLSVFTSSVLLNFALLNPLIDKVIIGIDNIDNLIDNLGYLKDKEKIRSIYDKLLDLAESDEGIILPLNWK